VTQVVDHLLSKCEAMSSKASTDKKVVILRVREDVLKSASYLHIGCGPIYIYAQIFKNALGT
jgi:hypothetical protein